MLPGNKLRWIHPSLKNVPRRRMPATRSTLYGTSHACSQNLYTCSHEPRADNENENNRLLGNHTYAFNSEKQWMVFPSYCLSSKITSPPTVWLNTYLKHPCFHVIQTLKRHLNNARTPGYLHIRLALCTYRDKTGHRDTPGQTTALV
jgi:hypothetical protein